MKEDLGKWIEENLPQHNMSYANTAHNQFTFVQNGIWELRNDPDVIDVVGTHVSKSITLPVYQFEMDDKVITMRCNFHDWIVSVKSKTPIRGINTLVIFNDYLRLHPYQCEGMGDAVYGSYVDDNSEFTIRLDNEYAVYCVLKLISVSPNHVLVEFLPEDI